MFTMQVLFSLQNLDRQIISEILSNGIEF